MKKIYVSGKITGLEIDYAKSLFDKACNDLKSYGYEPINPMELVPYEHGKTWEEYMIDDIRILLKCDGIYMLNNHCDSKGAKIELAIAKSMDKLIMYQ